MKTRKTLKLLTAIALAFLITSCGGGGDRKDISELYGNPATTTTATSTSTTLSVPSTGLTIVSATTKSVSRDYQVSAVPNYLFTSGLKAVLVCGSGVYSSDVQNQYYLYFSGGEFTNCTLTFIASDTNAIVYTALDSINATSGSLIALNPDMTLTVEKGESSLFPKTDVDGDKVADDCEEKIVSPSGMEKATLYNKTVIVVLEGDDLGSSSLTEYLQENYDELVAGLQNNPTANTKFVVIWDGGQKNGLDGNSDVFILDPSSGKTFSVLNQDISYILSGDSVSNYYFDGIKFWYAFSDNLSNHLKELIEVAAKMYPAKSYDLIISDHGDGWVSLSTPTTRTVFFESFNNGTDEGITWLGTKQFVDDVLVPLSKEGIKFDLLGFDECLMGEFATFVLLQSYANVIVASPEYEQADGWGTVWENLPIWYASTNDTWSIAKDIVDGYISYYTSNPPNIFFAYPTVIGLIAVKTTAIEQLRQSFEQFAESLYNTALNEQDNGQMYKVFYSHFSNNDTLTYFDTLWVSSEWSSEDADSALQTLVSATPGITTENYHYSYGDRTGFGYNTLGADLLFAVTSTGAVARAYELGYTAQEINLTYGNTSNPLIPNFDTNIVQSALNFLSTYNSIKNTDGLYTKYLYLDMQGGYDENVTGSGLSLIYPYTSPDYASSPKLELCNYQNFIDSYNSTLPYYTKFVDVVFDEMWKAIRDTGLDNKFSCNVWSGNIVWK